MLNPLKTALFILPEYVADSLTHLTLLSSGSVSSGYNCAISYSNAGTSHQPTPLMSTEAHTSTMQSASDAVSGRALFGIRQKSASFHERWCILLQGQTVDTPAVIVENQFSFNKKKLNIHVGGTRLCLRDQSNFKPRTNVYLGGNEMGMCVMTIKGDVADVAEGVDVSLVGFTTY